MITKFGNSEIEAAEEQVASLIDSADEWAVGLGHARLLIRKLRCISKPKAPRKFAQLDDTASKLYSFLQKCVLENVSRLSLTFRMLRLKCRFQKEQDVVGHGKGCAMLPTGFAAMVALGLAEALHSLASEGSKGSDWLRGILVGEVSHQVEVVEAEEVEGYPATLAADLDKLLKALRSVSKTDLMQELIIDFEALQKIACAGGTDRAALAIEAVAAKSHVMGCSRLARLQKALRESHADIELLAPIANMEHESASGKLGDQRFGAGMECFQDTAMLRVELCAGEVGVAGDEDGPRR